MSNIFQRFAYICEEKEVQTSLKEKSCTEESIRKPNGEKERGRDLEVIEILDSDEDNEANDKKIGKYSTAQSNKEEVDMKAPVIPVVRSQSVSTTAEAVVGGLKELYKSPKQDQETALKLLIVGHNPSHQSYTKGHYYANPVNRFWQLMRKGGLVPNHYTPNHDEDCPRLHRIGFTDVAWNYCETKSANLSDSFLYDHCKNDFYHRLTQHLQRVHSNHPQLPQEHCAPRIIAFTGVRQWKALFPANHPIQKMNIGQNKQKRKKDEEEGKDEDKTKDKDDEDKVIVLEDSNDASERREASSAKRARKEVAQQRSSLLSFVTVTSSASSFINTAPAHKANNSMEEPIKYGPQTIKPPDWPHLLARSIVFLLPSPSGAAAMSNEQREGPYLALGELYRSLKDDEGPENIARAEIDR